MTVFDPDNDENHQNDSQIVEMIVRYYDSEMTIEELEEFNAILRRDPRARSLLVRMSTQETRMAELLYRDQPGSVAGDKNHAPDSSECEVANPSSSVSRFESSLPLKSEALPVISSDVGTQEANPLVPSQQPFFGGAGITSILGSHLGIVLSAVTFLLLFAGLYQWSRQRSENGPVSPIAAVNDSARTEKKLVGTGPLEVRTIRTNSGSTKFTLANIGYVITEGPTDLEMVGPMHAKLNSGRIKVRVTEKTGQGFVVETPDGKVTDLGTEFILGVSSAGASSLAVTEGKVNLQVAQNDMDLQDSPMELLVEGDGVNFKKGSEAERIMSIVRGDRTETFQFVSDTVEAARTSLISEVVDTINKRDTRKFYEIVPHGFKEDVLMYVDRPHQWNGLTTEGLPKYLVGADYVKTFNSDAWRKDIEIRVTLNKPARLLLFVDERQDIWEWLKKDFRNTGDKIGADAASWGKRQMRRKAVGPGNSIDDIFCVWEKIVTEPGTVILGSPNLKGTVPTSYSMYGIAAVPLTDADIKRVDHSATEANKNSKQAGER